MAASCDAPANTIVEKPIGGRAAEPVRPRRRAGHEPERHDADEHRRHRGRAGPELGAGGAGIRASCRGSGEPTYFRNLDVVLSASTLPPVWQVAQ